MHPARRDLIDEEPARLLVGSLIKIVAARHELDPQEVVQTRAIDRLVPARVTIDHGGTTDRAVPVREVFERIHYQCEIEIARTAANKVVGWLSPYSDP